MESIHSSLEFPEVLNTAEVARLLRQHPQTLWKLRQSGEGPPFSRIGRRVLYLKEDVLEYLRQQREVRR